MSNIDDKTIQIPNLTSDEEVEEEQEQEVDLSELCCGGDCINGCDRYDIDRDNELAFAQ